MRTYVLTFLGLVPLALSAAVPGCMGGYEGCIAAAGKYCEPVPASCDCLEAVAKECFSVCGLYSAPLLAFKECNAPEPTKPTEEPIKPPKELAKPTSTPKKPEDDPKPAGPPKGDKCPGGSVKTCMADRVCIQTIPDSCACEWTHYWKCMAECPDDDKSKWPPPTCEKPGNAQCDEEEQEEAPKPPQEESPHAKDFEFKHCMGGNFAKCVRDDGICVETTQDKCECRKMQQHRCKEVCYDSKVKPMEEPKQCKGEGEEEEEEEEDCDGNKARDTPPYAEKFQFGCMGGNFDHCVRDDRPCKDTTQDKCECAKMQQKRCADVCDFPMVWRSRLGLPKVCEA